MEVTTRSCHAKAYISTTLSFARRSARSIVIRVFWLLIIAGLFFGCAVNYVDVPQPARLSLPSTGSMVITVPDISYQEVVLGLQLRKQLRKAAYYHVPKNKELEEYLGRTGQTIQDMWKDPKLAQGLNVDIVITPRVIEWKKEESAPQRRLIPDSYTVVQYCTKITGTLRAAFTLWRVSDGSKLFEDEVSSSSRATECAAEPKKSPSTSTTAGNGEAKAPSKTYGVSVPNPFLKGVLDASWESDPLFESAVKKAVTSFIDDIDPNPVREVFISANDTTGYKSGRQLVKARGYLRDDDWAAALKVLEENLGSHPDSYASQYLIGVAQQGQKNFESARNSYKQALALCQSKRDASSPETAPDCGYIEEAYNHAKKWDAETASPVPPKPTETH